MKIQRTGHVVIYPLSSGWRGLVDHRRVRATVHSDWREFVVVDVVASAVVDVVAELAIHDRVAEVC